MRVKTSNGDSVHVLPNGAGAVLDDDNRMVAYSRDGVAYCGDSVPDPDCEWEWIRSDRIWSPE